MTEIDFQILMDKIRVLEGRVAALEALFKAQSDAAYMTVKQANKKVKEG